MAFIVLVDPGEWREEILWYVGEINWLDKGEEIKEHLKEWLSVSREELSCLEVIELDCFLLILEFNAL